MAEHFNETGIGAIWLSPIFKSPMADFGYDISDFIEIDNTFGTLNDFISLQKKLKTFGIIKLIKLINVYFKYYIDTFVLVIFRYSYFIGLCSQSFQ